METSVRFEFCWHRLQRYVWPLLRWANEYPSANYSALHCQILWVSATDNAERINQPQLSGWVFPIHADARELPFAHNFFDAIVSIDAFEYFGTDATFLPAVVRYLKPNCQIGTVNAGVRQEMTRLPDEWPSDFNSFHTAQWWCQHRALPRLCLDCRLP